MNSPFDGRHMTPIASELTYSNMRKGLQPLGKGITTNTSTTSTCSGLSSLTIPILKNEHHNLYCYYHHITYTLLITNYQTI